MLEDMSKIEVYELSDTPLKKHLGTAQEIELPNPYGKQAFSNYGKQEAIIRELEEFRNQELEYKKAVGFDSMALLDQGGHNKQAYEAATDAATITLITGGSDNAGADIRSQYS